MIESDTRSVVFLILFLFTFQLSCLNAQARLADTTNEMRPMPISYDFEITGALTNQVWEQASPVYIKYEVQPDDQAPAQTKVKVLYSKKFLYIGFFCEDPNPKAIRAHIDDRDDSFRDDFVGIFLDPFNNNQHGYELFINPLGIQMDGMRTGDNEDMNFDALWYSEGMVNDSGYTAVMKIPFKSLNFPSQRIQDWSIQFIRVYPRHSRYQLVWSHVDNSNSCLLCQNGRLVNMKGVKNSNTVELIPYGISYQGSAIKDPDDLRSGLDNGPLEARVGVFLIRPVQRLR